MEEKQAASAKTFKLSKQKLLKSIAVHTRVPFPLSSWLSPPFAEQGQRQPLALALPHRAILISSDISYATRISNLIQASPLRVTVVKRGKSVTVSQCH